MNQSKKNIYVDIVFNIPLYKSFTYLVPKTLKNKINFGQRIFALFGKNRKMKGYIISIHNKKPNFKCKEIQNICDDSSLFDEEILKISKWMSKYYLCSLGEALATYLPKETSEKIFKIKKYNNNENNWPNLNNEQKIAIKEINTSIINNKFKTHLLYGITGSGKTEIYKHISQKSITFGKQALILFPEIILSSQTISRFQEVFKNRITILHSKLTQKERLYNWKLILKHKVDIILGVRSAIFCPPKNIGIIILDEEHDSSYKSNDTPRYHTRQIAYKICQIKKIPLVLGSATPNIETFYHSYNKDIKLLTLKKRHTNIDKKKILIDMKKETSLSLISQKLFEELNHCLNKNEQSMILLNKRGHSSLLLCYSCGKSFKCPNCDISLTYHKSIEKLLCHYCSYLKNISKKCLYCNSNEIKLIGYGIEQLENILTSNFMKAKIARMDFDTTRTKGSYEKILNSFKKKEIDILIGTQMIAKGLHFPNVTLVGVILADMGLHLPDFRASEKTFSLLTQISGRAGRGDFNSKVIIQSYLTKNYVIQSAIKEDYKSFYDYELKIRKEFQYPPFTRLVKLLVRGKKENLVIDFIKELAENLKKNSSKKIKILGPINSPLSKINNNYRWQIILKSLSITLLQNLARIAFHIARKNKNIYLEIDIDPTSMM